MKICHWQVQKCTLSIPRVEIGLIFALRGPVFEIWTISKIAIFGHKNWSLAQFYESYTYSLFRLRGLISSLLLLYHFVYGQHFPRYGPIFKLAIFRHGTWPLAKAPEISQCTGTLFLPQWGRNWDYFCCMGSGFWDTAQASKLPYLGMKLGHWQRSRSCAYALFLPQGVEIQLILNLWAAVSETRTDFQNCYIRAWNLVTMGHPEVAYILSLPQGVKIELIIFALYAAVSEIRADFQNCHMGIKLGYCQKFQELHTYIVHVHSFYSMESKLSLFSLYRQWFRDTGRNCHIWAGQVVFIF